MGKGKYGPLSPLIPIGALPQIPLVQLPGPS